MAFCSAHAVNTNSDGTQLLLPSADGTKLVACVINGQIYTYAQDGTTLTQSTTGTTGQITAGDGHAVELQYVGNDSFRIISHEGTALGAQ